MYWHVYVYIHMYLYVCIGMYMCTYMYMDIYVHVFAYVFYFQNLSFRILLLFLLFFYHLFNTDCMSLIMYKGEVTISDSLLLPPFSNQSVE